MDKPIKKPPQKAETVAQSTEATDLPIARIAGDQWLVEVHPHPIVKSRFSSALTISGRPRLNLNPVDDYHPKLFGCFSTPHEAITAGLESVEV